MKHSSMHLSMTETVFLAEFISAWCWKIKIFVVSASFCGGRLSHKQTGKGRPHLVHLLRQFASDIAISLDIANMQEVIIFKILF